MSDDAHLEKMVQQAAHSLGEHFDAVLILATARIGNNTRIIHMGEGNLFARTGMARDYLVKRDEDSRREMSDEK